MSLENVRRTVNRHPIHWLLAAACVAGCLDTAIAQTAPATILKIDTQNFTNYVNDVTDFAKLATNPEQTNPARAANFETFIYIADIVAVNGRPSRGQHLCRGLRLSVTATPAPGQAISDVLGKTGGFVLYLDFVETILSPDGTLIGSITFRGFEKTDPPPRAPLGQTNATLALT